jgi:hypothetical protein
LFHYAHEVRLDEVEFRVTEVAVAFVADVHSKFWTARRGVRCTESTRIRRRAAFFTEHRGVQVRHGEYVFPLYSG